MLQLVAGASEISVGCAAAAVTYIVVAGAGVDLTPAGALFAQFLGADPPRDPASI